MWWLVRVGGCRRVRGCIERLCERVYVHGCRYTINVVTKRVFMCYVYLFHSSP